jgi:hypothetical protein
MTSEGQRAEAHLPNPHGAVFALACAAFCSFLIAILAYGRYGGSFVEGLEHSIGEIALSEAIRLEYAKEYADAIEAYRQALERRFDYPANKTEALRRLGTLLWWREGAAQGLPYLEAAYDNGDFSIWLYEPLCSALMEAGRDQEVLEHAQAWLSRASSEGRNDHEDHARQILKRMQAENSRQTH